MGDCDHAARIERLELEMQEALKDHRDLGDRFTECQNRVIRELEKVTARIESIPQQKHDKHHYLLEQMIEERRLHVEFWRGALQKLATAGIWTTVVLVCTALWYAFTEFVKQRGLG